jgi:type VI secretion system secreted protein Hcp
MQKLLVVVLMGIILLTYSLQTNAYAAAYIKIKGIDGESKDSKYRDWIELSSYDFGINTSGSGAGGGAGKAKFSDISITKHVDKASPVLMVESAAGKHFESAELVATKSSGEPYMTIKFKDILISSYQGMSDPDTLTEQVSLNFAQIEFEYGTTKAGWDVKSNKKISISTQTEPAPSSKPPESKPISETKQPSTTESITPEPVQPKPIEPTPVQPKVQPTPVKPVPITVDSDRDGITDDKDKCPKEAETKNNYQDDDGCPDTAPMVAVPIKPKLTIPLK